GRDRPFAVRRQVDEPEPAVRLERNPDPLRALGHLVRGYGHAHERLSVDVVREMARRIDDLHQPPPVGGRSADRIAAATSRGRYRIRLCPSWPNVMARIGERPTASRAAD